jgi:hypothetical protein
MTDVNELYRILLQHKSEIDSSLTHIESSPEAPSIATQQRLSFLINEFSRVLDDLREKVKNLDPKSRTTWDIRTSRFGEDLKLVKLTCDRRLGLLFKSQREQEHRDFLLGNSASVSGDHQAQLLNERRSIDTSHNMLDSITDQSKAILDRIVGQNMTLKNARGKMYDLINNAGIGQSLAGSIHSRERADAIILYSCMLLTLVVFFLLWWLVK